MPQEPEHERQFLTNKARQGQNSRRVLWILVFSLIAVGFVWVIAEIYYNTAVAPENAMSDAVIPDDTGSLDPDGTR